MITTDADMVGLLQKLDLLRCKSIPLIAPTELVPCQEQSDPDELCKHPVVSATIITYNHEPYIREAIENVLNQECDFEYELIIAEDCSTDNTREICFEYQKKYPKIIRVLYSESNVGMQKNGVRMLHNIRGQYVAFCDGDDFWIRKDKLQLQMDFLRRTKSCNLCAGEWFRKNEITGVVTCRQSHGKTIRNSFLRYQHCQTSTWMMTTHLLKEILAFSGTCPLIDEFMLTQAMILGPVYILPYKLSTYRDTGVGIWTSKDLSAKVLMRLGWVLPQYRIQNNKRWFIAQTIRNDYWCFIKLLVENKKYYDALRYCIYSISLLLLNPILFFWLPYRYLDININRIKRAYLFLFKNGYIGKKVTN